MNRSPDTVEFYKGDDGDWWWKRTAPNNERVGGSTEGYRNFKDCLDNAMRNNGNAVAYINPRKDEADGA